MGCRVLGAHDGVGRVLELIALLELRLDTDFVERSAHERRLHTDPEQAQSPAGLQPDLVETGRKHVGSHVTGALTERLCPGKRWLAAGREGTNTDAQLLHSCPR